MSGPSVYQQFYSGTTWTGGITARWNRTDLEFPSGYNLCNISSIYQISAEFITAIEFPTTGTVRISFGWDDGWNIYFDDTQFSYGLGLPAMNGVFFFNVVFGHIET